MCGINGFNFPDQTLVGKMNDRVKHRGPDAEGVFTDAHVSLGHRRLAILDLTDAGKQPMGNADGSVQIVFNGEIYNFQELREELRAKGYAFHSNSDTEVIIHAYEAYGIDCTKRFNGIFAFALWDARARNLYLVRDHIGVKPLYYYWDQSKLIFSSEIKAILAHPVPRKLNLEAFNMYLRLLYVPAPLTMFEQIQKVEPGTYLLYREGKLTTNRYWQPSHERTKKSKAEIIAEIQTLMRDSVKRQLISERPVGVFLSGGIDSTAVLGLAKEAMGSAVKTYSVGFDVAPEKFNADLELARKTSAFYGTDHHECIVTGDDCAKYLPEVIYHMDEPVANATQIATYLLSELARRDIVVSLGGDGGDELFGGYERYRLSRLVSFYQRLPFMSQLRLSRGMQYLPAGFRDEVQKMEVPSGAPRLLSFMSQKEQDIGKIIRPEINKVGATLSFFERHYFTERQTDPENELMWADIRSWLPDESLVRSDKLSMAHALEQRVPILDYRLVELSLTIPSSWKLAGRTKSLFTYAMKPYLPAHVLHEPKRGWTSPASEWLRTSLKPLASEVLSKEFCTETAGLFDFDALQGMFNDHVEKRAYHLNLLWAVMTFQLWYRQCMKGERV